MALLYDEGEAVQAGEELALAAPAATEGEAAKARRRQKP